MNKTKHIGFKTISKVKYKIKCIAANNILQLDQNNANCFYYACFTP